ncbi:MAG: hypothetical protein MUE60_06615, partial [Candidatus Eisenbacteria bacterium]|nr:hypothetical protein [Candidatus Eisenbacteria bacterium]
PQICAEIGYARVQSDFAELERAIQHLYDTNATLRGHGLEAGVFKRETHGLALGVLTRFSPRLAAGLTGVLTKSSSVTGAAMGEVRVRPGVGFCPWLSAGMMWQRIRVKDHQYVEVQSQPDRWFFKGLTWKAPTSAFALGLRFDTAPDIGAGLTFAFYWVSSPHIHSTIHGDWSQWNPLAGEFPASIRIDTLVFTAGLQIN